MSAIVGNAQCCACKGFACILIDLCDFQLRHFFIGECHHNRFCVCNFNVLVVIFVQNVTFGRHFLRNGYRAGNVFNRHLSAVIRYIMPDCRCVHFDLEYGSRQPFLCAFVHL